MATLEKEKKAKVYECKHGCGYTHHHAGTVNLHERNHCPIVNQAIKDGCTCADPCWRLLDMRKANEKDAVMQGWKEVCERCLELRK